MQGNGALLAALAEGSARGQVGTVVKALDDDTVLAAFVAAKGALTPSLPYPRTAS
jgi:hypothetical protein